MSVIVVLDIFIFLAFLRIFVTSRHEIYFLPSLCGLLVTGLAILAPLVWNDYRTYAGSGYLGFLRADEQATNSFRTVLFCISLGVLMGCLTLLTLNRRSATPRLVEFSELIPAPEKITSLIKLNLLCVLIFILGTGPSILKSQSYLALNGIGLVGRINGMTQLLAMAFLYLSTRRVKDGKNFQSILFITIIWTILFLGKGSRLALVAVFIVTLLMIQKVKHRIVKVLVSLLGFILIVFSLQLIYLARVQAHGVLLLPSTFAKLITNFSLESSWQTIAQIPASFLFLVLLVPYSIGAANFSLILSNSNPLIANTDPYAATSGGVERLYPYSWVPTSSAGEFYGVFGSIGLIAIAFLLTFVYGLPKVVRNQQRTVLDGASSGLYAIQFFILLEYSTRIWFRLFWTELFLCLFLLMLNSFEQTKNNSSPNTRHHASY